MFYEPGQPHGLPRDPFRSLVVPRPIAWITSLDSNGIVNVAPYSHFNICSAEPPTIMFSAGASTRSETKKDSQRNAEQGGEFVVNIVTYAMREVMNRTSAEVAPTSSEANLYGLATSPSQMVKPPRLADSPVQLECKYLMTVTLPPAKMGDPVGGIVFGRVVGIHISDDVLTDGMVDIRKLRPVARLGYMDYAVIDEVFAMPRP